MSVPTNAQRQAAIARNLPVSRPAPRVSEFDKGYQAALTDLLAALEVNGEAGAQEWIDTYRQGW